MYTQKDLNCNMSPFQTNMPLFWLSLFIPVGQLNACFGLGRKTTHHSPHRIDRPYLDTWSPHHSTARRLHTLWHVTPPACSHGYTWRWLLLQMWSASPVWSQRVGTEVRRMRLLNNEKENKQGIEKSIKSSLFYSNQGSCDYCLWLHKIYR